MSQVKATEVNDPKQKLQSYTGSPYIYIHTLLQEYFQEFVQWFFTFHSPRIFSKKIMSNLGESVKLVSGWGALLIVHKQNFFQESCDYAI